MPGGDGTGPLGMGPMTGRAAGFCAGYPVPGYMSPAPGRGAWGRGGGLGRGRGFGRGWGRGWWARACAPPAYGRPAYAAPPLGWPQPTPEQETDLLKQQAELLQGQLEAIRKRLDELAKEPVKD